MQHNDKKIMIRRISAINKKSYHLAIFKVLVDNQTDCTIDSNGVFFNITPLGTDILHHIDRIVKEYECTSSHARPPLSAGASSLTASAAAS